MNVPFELRRLPACLPATALLLPGHDVGRLLNVCARLSPMPTIHPVVDGFLLKLAGSITEPCPGLIRLRGLAHDLFVPADAELVPPLHADEYAGLTRDCGLVFVPGGRVLAFAPDRVLPLSRILTLGPVQRDHWKPLPAPRQFPERIVQITLELPERSAEQILGISGRPATLSGEPAEDSPGSGGIEADDIGTEDPRPEDAGLAAKLAGGAGLVAGKVMFTLGQLLYSKMLAGLGARLMNQALALAPRLSEAVFGRQEAALRALLRLFEQGEVERALRRAVPFTAPEDRGPVRLGGSFRLPFNNLLYSLRNLLGTGGGISRVWSGESVWSELQRQYRKAAEEALQRGDYRRAALIYGKLLRDYRSAANALAQGGLFRDAAIVYLEKLDDEVAAARMFEECGEIDRAIQLYRQTGDHGLVGDALRRAGEPQAALAEYQLAATHLVEAHQDYHGAGELMLLRAQDGTLAQEYFEAGWSRRPERVDIPCALRLLALYAQRPAPEALLKLVAEAEELLCAPGNAPAACQFFNALATAARGPELAGVHADLLDRARVAMAAKVRQLVAGGARPGDLVTTFFGPSGAWDPALVSDADFAIRSATRSPLGRAAEPVIGRTQLRQGMVTATCFAPGSGDVFLGYEDGALLCFRPGSGASIRLPGDHSKRVTSLATTPDGRLVVALRDGFHVAHELTSYMLVQGEYRVVSKVDGQNVYCYLTPMVIESSVTGSRHPHLVGLATEQNLTFLRPASLLYVGRLVSPEEDATPAWCSTLMLPSPCSPLSTIILLFGNNSVWYRTEPGAEGPRGIAPVWKRAWLSWTPGVPAGNPFLYPLISWLHQGAQHLDLAGVDNNGIIHGSRVDIRPEHFSIVSTQAAVRAEGYLATAITRPGLIAGVSRSHIDWLRSKRTRIVPETTMRASLPHAVACFACSSTKELIVVCQDGVVARVPVPK